MRKAIAVWMGVGLAAAAWAADISIPTIQVKAVHPPYEIKVLAPDGAWTWYNDERAILDGDVLYIGCQDSKGVSRVDLYHFNAKDETSAHIEYPLSSWRSKDDHNNPALLKLADGRILTAYAKHHAETQWYWRVAEVADHGTPTQHLEWGPEQVFKTPAKTTYNNLFQLSGEKNRIYNFSRNLNFNPSFHYSDDNAQNWSGPFVLIQTGTGGVRPYVKYASNGKDRIDFLYTDGHPRDIKTNNIYHLYYQAGSFYQSDGSLIKTLDETKTNPLKPGDGTRIYDGSGQDGRGWVHDLEYDKDGSPVGVFINSVDGDVGNDLRYRYARWDSKTKQWHQRQIAFAGSHIYVPENHYAGGITIDPDNVNVVYLSANVAPADGSPESTGHFQMYQGTTADNGKTWSWKRLTDDDDKDNLRPFVPTGHKNKLCVLWFRGQYKTYTDFKTEIVGIIEK